MTKRSSYGSWTGPIEYDETEAAQSPVANATPAPTESAQPATDRAQGQFGTGAVVTFFLGFMPGLQGLWAVTAVCVVILIVSPVVGSLEASSKQKARDHGGGGCDVVVAGVILVVLAVGAFLVFAGMAGGGT